MTNEEAIKWIKEHHNMDLDGCKDSTAMRMAIEALQRQKCGTWKPHGKTIGGRFTLWKCSVCGCVIFSEDEQDKTTFHKYCGMCGAKMEDET